MTSKKKRHNEDDNEDQQSDESNSKKDVTYDENELKATDSESYVEESVSKSDFSYRLPRRVCAAKDIQELQDPKLEENAS